MKTYLAVTSGTLDAQGFVVAAGTLQAQVPLVRILARDYG
jgi:hypothetical protein